MYSNDTTESGAAGAPFGAGRARRSSALSPRVVTWGCVLLGLALLSPSLTTGLVADDYLHALMLRDDPGLRGLTPATFDLFRFADGRPETARALIDEGVFPWWVDPRALLAFFRPLSSLSHYLDHRLWPSQPALMHLHSLLWYGALIAIVAAVYRRLGTSRRAASLALLLFAIDDAHAPLVGWVANRNAVIALCFALPALLVHDRQRRAGFRHGVWLGPLLLAFGLCGGEVALGVLAYLVAYAACVDGGRWYARFGSLLPYVLVVATWKLCCLQLGYGVSGSGLYVDPLADPVGFVRAASERFPVLALGLFLGPFADLWELYPLLSPWLRVAVLALGLVALLALGLVLSPLLRRDPRLELWVMGTVLCLLPMCATFPHDRLLLAPGVGGMAVIAALLEAGWARRGRTAVALGAAALAAVHLLAAPMLAPWRAADVGRFSALLRESDASLPAGEALRGKTLVLLNPPLDPLAAYLPAYRQVNRTPRPLQQLWLATGTRELFVSRLDAHRLLLRPEGGFLSESMQRMLRGPAPPFERGQRVQLDGAHVLVTDVTDDGRPLQITVRFERELGDPSLIWMRWQRRGYEPFRLPPVGQSVLLPGVAILDLLQSI
jgi:hypothetical protein